MTALTYPLPSRVSHLLAISKATYEARETNRSLPTSHFCPIPTASTNSHERIKMFLDAGSQNVALPHIPVSQFHNMGVLGINRADTDGWMGSMGLASNLGKVAVRPCKLPCWEPSRGNPSSPPTLPLTRYLPRASPFALPIWHEIQFGFSDPSLLLPREEK